MITVENLIKDYGQVRALHGVSFEVPRGQVLGFLGPNGAGKSTTMKVLTGFLCPTAGRAVLAGHEVTQDPLEVRRNVGYLPETNPLYMDMRVDDYLRFAAEVRGVGARERSRAVDKVVSECGLSRVLKKKIMELSKGYKQRVGLAQAMIHEPPILILDEPTSGLDPNQIIEIRELIRRVGENRTVILSTHILSEVEASCGRILIISQGNLAADGTAQELCEQLPGGPLEVEILGPPEAIEAQLRELFVGGTIEHLSASHSRQGGEYFVIHVDPKMDQNAREAVYDLVTGNGWKIVHLARERATLEAVFRRFTLSDEQARDLEIKATHLPGDPVAEEVGA